MKLNLVLQPERLIMVLLICICIRVLGFDWIPISDWEQHLKLCPRNHILRDTVSSVNFVVTLGDFFLLPQIAKAEENPPSSSIQSVSLDLNFV